jgi:diaminohydroxyphosphoribosylaminopyrimidine deaminase/5-amino-6-(5-phosphoribosylamino)uracil reductase
VNERRHEELIPWMRRAVRIAWRGHGGAEPNPMVGCVILDSAGRFVAEGHHRRCGGPHAEADALARAGSRARGGTAVVTLEPCNHHGRTGPCSLALRRAGIARVAYACEDPNPVASGGAAALRASGVAAFRLPCPEADDLAEPFLRRIRAGRPWVIVKYAQSADFRIAGRPGDPRWISSAASRLMVHRERGRVDAVLTGMGTVLADDPLLTVRGVSARRVPLRAVWDPRLVIGLGRALVRTAHEHRTVIGCTAAGLASGPHRAAALRAAGAETVEAADPAAFVRALGSLGCATVLVEAGPGLVRALDGAGAIDDLWVFTAPHRIGDAGPRTLAPFTAERLASLRRLWGGMRGGDRVDLYRLPA